MLTTTQFIRKAALKNGFAITPTPWNEKKKTARGGEDKFEKDGLTVVKLYDKDLINVPDDKCWLCGGETKGKGGLKKKVIKDTFTDHDLAKNMKSNSVCPGCTFCLSFSSFRNYSIIATEKELIHPGKDKTRDLLLNPPKPPFVFCIAVSGQKWLHFKAPINYNSKRFIVMFEEMPIPVRPELITSLLIPIEKLYTIFSKAEILTGDYNQSRIKQFGIVEWEQLEAEISKERGSRIFQLAVYIAQKEEGKS